MKRGVIFDVGGVLAYDVWEHLLCDPAPKNKNAPDPVSISAEYGVPDDQLREIGKELWGRYDDVTGDPLKLERDYWQAFVSHPRCPDALTSVPIQTFIDKTNDFIRPANQDMATRLLEWLVSKGVRLGICSNNNEFWFRYQATTLGLYRFFAPSSITLSCRHGITKGDFRLFHIAGHSLGLHPTECIFVDDRMSNVSRSVECGMTGVLFPSEQSESEPQHGAEYLRRLLERIFA